LTIKNRNQSKLQIHTNKVNTYALSTHLLPKLSTMQLSKNC